MRLTNKGKLALFRKADATKKKLWAEFDLAMDLDYQELVDDPKQPWIARETWIEAEQIERFG
jgi:hypothetical protein